jgi:hypothetical protein
VNFEDAYAMASRVLVRLADGQLGRMVVFRLRTESVDVQLPGGQLRTLPSTRLRLEDGFMVETTA